jgi:hypothetical protein
MLSYSECDAQHMLIYCFAVNSSFTEYLEERKQWHSIIATLLTGRKVFETKPDTDINARHMTNVLSPTC